MSGKKNTKQAFVKESPSGEKSPKTASEPPSYTDSKASWRVCKIQLIDPYGWHELDPAGVGEVQAKLSTFEKSTWKELFVVNARQNHRVPASELKCPVARQWMKDNMPDQPYLWTLRLSGQERIWGILSEGAYLIVFWDPHHLIWEIAKN
jgi:hypothetical protein